MKNFIGKFNFKKKPYVKFTLFQKIPLLFYLSLNVYKAITINPFFIFFTILPFLYLFLKEQPRIKGFLGLKARDRRVRLNHYYTDFYVIWWFVNISTFFIVILVLFIWYFEFIKTYLLSIGIVIPFTLNQLVYTTSYWGLLVTGINWLTNMYIIWFKNTQTYLKFFASQEVTIGAGLSAYFGLHAFVHATPPETNPIVHYYYHSYEPFLGRGYHFRHSSQLEQSNLVMGAMGNRYNPKELLDANKYLDINRFYAYVWSNRVKIGANMTDLDKAKFPSWIRWSPDFQSDPTKILNDQNEVIGRINYNSQNQLITSFNDGVNLETFYNNESFENFDRRVLVVAGSLDRSETEIDYEPRMISPVQSEDSYDSLNSKASAGELITSGVMSKTDRK